jgi:predicted Ser/Thr protein kinase/pimeloyl-ACP methyl ester carboxylesterase
MTDDRWPRIKRLFEAAVEQPQSERSAFLAAASAGDEALRQEVEALLAADSAGASLSEQLPVTPESLQLALPPSSTPIGADDPSRPGFAGRRLGNYEVIASLGAGGMGEVYRARDTRLHRDVALKVLTPALVADPRQRASLVQEARAASALEHPHIAVIHEIADADDMTFIVMELVRGEPLGALVSRGPVPAARAIELALETAEALARAHEIGIVHRDLKPANIMITADGHVKIIDFGIAKLTGAREGHPTTSVAVAERLTGSGIVVGTAAYMSPEQARGQAVDHRTDIFSFGIVLQEMLTGSPPFRRRSSVDTMHAILHDAPPRLPDWIGGATDDLQHVIDTCLAKKPGDRYETMTDVVADLRTARRRLESAELRAIEGPPAFDRRLRIAAVVAVVIALAITAAIWSTARRTRDNADRAARIAEVKQLVDSGRFVDVWRVARAALQRWPGDPDLEQMLRSTSQTVTLATDPPGADLAFKAYDDRAGGWLPIGTSPIKGVSVPLGMLRWRITKSGFDPLEARLEVGTPAAAVGRPDVDAKPIRLRPVGSAVGRMVFVPGGVFEGVQLTDYWIDQYEVTNRDFKSVVDRDGYDNRFRDRTDRPGPSTWQLGTYTSGEDGYPVRGVSWFEAVAYCRAVGKSLPTRHHWRKAFGATFFSEVVTAGNFSGRGPESTERLYDVGPFGTVGQAGNVKEWVWNDHGDQRYILGGGWNEPVYMAVADDARPALDRADTNGFRCIKESAPSSEAAYAARSPNTINFANKKPVDDATFEVFRRFYSYERTPLDARTESVQESEFWRRERVSFAAAYSGERVPVNILIPRNVSPPYQAIVWFPGSYAFDLKHSDGDLPFSYYFDFLPRSGRALVYPVYKGTYERAMPVQAVSQWRDTIRQWSQDLSRTIDYLNSRSDFDKEKIAYYGFSSGATGALPAVALESRLKAAILLAGGLFDMSLPPEADAFNFAPRIKTPTLLLGGEYDFDYPVDTSQRPLFKLLAAPPEHKRHVVFEKAGHVPPRIEVIRETLDWLDRYLGPVQDRR